VALTSITGRVLARQWRARPPFELLAKPRHARFPGGRSFRVPALDLGMLDQQIRELF
jgi:hypothetical protein